MHGSHTTTIEDEKEFRLFIAKFESELSKHVDQIIRTRHEWNLGHTGGSALGNGLLGFGQWAGRGHLSAGHGTRQYVTLGATYERDHAMGTVIVHVSLDPSYATLTIVENVK